MERASLVANGHAILLVLARAKLAKVFGRFRANIAKELQSLNYLIIFLKI